MRIIASHGSFGAGVDVGATGNAAVVDAGGGATEGGGGKVRITADAIANVKTRSVCQSQPKSFAFTDGLGALLSESE